jgi:hypothetical protein
MSLSSIVWLVIELLMLIGVFSAVGLSILWWIENDPDKYREPGDNDNET